jgi:hypothetical protein
MPFDPHDHDGDFDPDDDDLNDHVDALIAALPAAAHALLEQADLIGSADILSLQRRLRSADWVHLSRDTRTIRRRNGGGTRIMWAAP